MQQAAVDMVGSLLHDAPVQEGPTATATAGRGAGALQRGQLQQLLLELLPPVGQRHLPASGSARSEASVTLKASQAAAAMFLELIRLRKQQEADQLQKFLAAKGSLAAS
jgi:hypothetical protein